MTVHLEHLTFRLMVTLVTSGAYPATHQNGARVVISPTFPSVDVKDAINETLLATFPDLYTTGVHTFVVSPAKSTYALPEEVETVLAVSYLKQLAQVKNGYQFVVIRVDSMANVEEFNSKNAISAFTLVLSLDAPSKYSICCSCRNGLKR